MSPGALQKIKIRLCRSGPRKCVRFLVILGFALLIEQIREILCLSTLAGPTPRKWPDQAEVEVVATREVEKTAGLPAVARRRLYAWQEWSYPHQHCFLVHAHATQLPSSCMHACIVLVNIESLPTPQWPGIRTHGPKFGTKDGLVHYWRRELSWKHTCTHHASIRPLTPPLADLSEGNPAEFLISAKHNHADETWRASQNRSNTRSRLLRKVIINGTHDSKAVVLQLSASPAEAGVEGLHSHA
jgi:hypothetical protein